MTILDNGGSASVVEAGIDNIQLDVLTCDEEAPCVGDITGDGNVDVNDLLTVIAEWGVPYDVNDVLTVIKHWGPCP